MKNPVRAETVDEAIKRSSAYAEAERYFINKNTFSIEEDSEGFYVCHIDTGYEVMRLPQEMPDQLIWWAVELYNMAFLSGFTRGLENGNVN
ncbi:hypothetical protein [Oceanisphaera sp. KMM 10153]|uniref:hypothetical protein n=1 Tax=Oceanisphaera submarina TaxID=3390193 RepID=UPI0039759293